MEILCPCLKLFPEKKFFCFFLKTFQEGTLPAQKIKKNSLKSFLCFGKWNFLVSGLKISNIFF